MLLNFLQDYFKTVLEFLKLEKVEFGGYMGQSLGKMVVEIFSEFTQLMHDFSSDTVNPLCLETKVKPTV